jgi:hypothetical protein
MVRNLIVGIVCLSQVVMASSLVTLSGDVLSGGSYLRTSQPIDKSMQFESAANLRVEVSPADNVTSLLELGLGQQNATGLETAVRLRRFNITYFPKRFENIKLSIGSLGVPFGQFAQDQTNNANIRSVFFINDLGYDYLSNPFSVSEGEQHSVKDFGASGLLTTATLDNKLGVIDVFVFNHTADHFNNKGGRFGFSARVVNSSFIDNTHIGLSGLMLDDSGEPKAIQGELKAVMVDVKTTLYEVDFGGSYMFVNVKDASNNTKNGLRVLMGYASKRFDNITVGLRYSSFAPDDFSGIGESNSGIIAPTLIAQSGQPANIDVNRLQMSGIVHLETSLNWHNELVLDTYSLNKEAEKDVAVFSYFSFGF